MLRDYEIYSLMAGKKKSLAAKKIAWLFFLSCFFVLGAAFSAWGQQPGAETFFIAAGPGDTAIQKADDKSQADEEFDEFDEFDKFDEFDEFNSSEPKSVSDPFSGYNRWMTRFNDRLYFWVLKPAATGYAKLTPAVARKSVGRFFKNLGYPIRFVNNVLQFKIKRAGVETARFVVNTTLGVAGLADPARWWWQLEAFPEDFGQTLGHYGVGGGFHLVLPVLGPSNLRDAVSRIPDRFLNPVDYVEPSEASLAISALEIVNSTSLRLGEYERLQKDAVDWYIFIRNAYEQNRKKQIQE